MVKKDIALMLRGSDRRTIGRSDEVAELVATQPGLFEELIAALESDDEAVRMRAADAAEKVSRTRPEMLYRHKNKLLRMLAGARQQELRWHLAAMAPRLRLSRVQCEKAATVLETYLEDSSSIVKTFALQGLAELAEQDAQLRARVIGLLRQAMRNGTPAMRARARKLLAQRFPC